ncbi:MAG: 6,7-dimethyl-8-ribityllumazine synthase [Ferruginibacter sp.]|nr:6,7-dimethyl-8-ribityllumazine synthase [Bacteroidota bacterium]MBX2918571.1 6,7-dimethyl-8-ribityllumazine synthase [Ferruginibacter sp.]MCB0708870.1 6,7-dimethyl-8-ribityllumazine synthase [Chitinophagaceae bacterium]MCC7378687.1 6,7-dimethyl-8-ribityllumazine synthase [Chitinophagaceae bacterium]
MSVNSSNLYNTTGIRLPKDACVVIVRTLWNAATIDKLEAGCLKILKENNVQYKLIQVPGSFEITFAIKKYWELHKYKEDKPHAFIALGCVLRGDTPHFEYVCHAVTNGILQLNLQLPVPTIFGILTVDNQQQIDERTGGNNGHKGEEAAATAIQMMAMIESIN